MFLCGNYFFSYDELIFFTFRSLSCRTSSLTHAPLRVRAGATEHFKCVVCDGKKLTRCPAVHQNFRKNPRSVNSQVSLGPSRGDRIPGDMPPKSRGTVSVYIVLPRIASRSIEQQTRCLLMFSKTAGHFSSASTSSLFRPQPSR